jgi:hypothetical protein
MAPSPIIANRGEFIDVLRALARGSVIVVADGHAVIDGNMIYFSLPVLIKYGLVENFENPEGFENVVYLRCTKRGHEFTYKVSSEWERKPVLERLAIRFFG